MSKIKVKKAYVEVYEDTYADGEGKYVNEWSLDELAGKEFRTGQDLVNAIARVDGVYTTDIGDYVYIDGRIDSDAEVNADNYTPTDAEYDAWKRGELMLYCAHLYVHVLVVPDEYSHEMTEEEAEAFGFYTY